MKHKLTLYQTKFLVFLLFCLIITVFYLVDGQQWLNLETLKQNRNTLLNYAEQHYLFLYLVCGLLYIVMTALSLPGGSIFSLAFGFLFGRWMGTLLIIISATIGATLVFLLARYLIADWARERLLGNKQAVKIMDAFQTDAFNYLLFLRLVPLFPFWLVNLVSAFTPISSRIYTITTLIGIIPGSFVFANLGQSLGQIENSEQLLSMPVLMAFTLLGILSLAPVLVKQYKATQSNK
ncbi:MAG: TVP38/TMEM64 family protein [Methylococcales bacterium]|nr:TVP38/TMEM64 family protein [Methylococcales bacterium]